MKQSKQKIQRELRELRAYIDHRNSDPLVSQVAYSMEHAVRWAIEDTVGWRPSLLDCAKTVADDIRTDWDQLQ